MSKLNDLEKKNEELQLKQFINFTQAEVEDFLGKMNDEMFVKAMNVIDDSKKNNGRLHITGIGKPSHVAEYISALLSSTGTPCYFLDGTEAVHGSAGQVNPQDVVIAISNSGGTVELRNTVEALKKIGVKIIGVTGNLDSWLAKNSDAVLYAGVTNEGDDTNKPPRLSIVAEILALQCLSILLQSRVNLTMDNYYLWHPGGALGEQAKKELADS